jgi:hypothetical protein
MKGHRHGLVEVMTALPLLVVSLFFLIGSMRLGAGELNQMGPGWYPMLLSAALLILIIVQMVRSDRSQPAPDRGMSGFIVPALTGFTVFVVLSHAGLVAIGAIATLTVMFAAVNRRNALEKWLVLLVASLMIILVCLLFSE